MNHLTLAMALVTLFGIIELSLSFSEQPVVPPNQEDTHPTQKLSNPEPVFGQGQNDCPITEQDRFILRYAFRRIGPVFGWKGLKDAKDGQREEELKEGTPSRGTFLVSLKHINCSDVPRMVGTPLVRNPGADPELVCCVEVVIEWFPLPRGDSWAPTWELEVFSPIHKHFLSAKNKLGQWKLLHTLSEF
ncbi:hypothetical protein [Candidatus Methylacidithermus pantelleriae]|uniref:Uncharacterized protein n=1 Tax=Candidatus Methylacidithermus pantelleriae TaxID=2744239 RepID=A0A8J2FWK4_9BACT|nr:hypothetical protein [Candidatus Methylacidithermus pantelleriae]CAF0699843.1 hypothetical protein MPNT_300015 [Candidatus Methylacidithermus pantelleriae]